MIRALGLEADDERRRGGGGAARIRAPRPRSIGSTGWWSESWVRDDTAERVRGAYQFRIDRFAARFDPEGDGKIEKQSLKYQRLRRDLLDAERQAVIELRNAGEISDEVMRLVERDLDLEVSRLDV